MWYVVDRYVSCLTGRTFLASYDRDDNDEDDSSFLHMDEDSTISSPQPQLVDDKMDIKVCFYIFNDLSEESLAWWVIYLNPLQGGFFPSRATTTTHP